MLDKTFQWVYFILMSANEINIKINPKIITEESLETDQSDVDVPLASPVLPVSVTPEILPPIKQKINNIEQKEDAMHYLGLTRKKYLRVIIDALEAYKWADVVDRQGNVKQEWVPDIEKQRWGAEQSAKLFGDYIQHVDANVRVTHSVEELLNVFEKAKLK